MIYDEKTLLELQTDLLKEHQLAYNQVLQIEGGLKLIKLQLDKLHESEVSNDDQDVTNATS